MKRLLVLCGIAAWVLIAFRHPATAPPALTTLEQPARPTHFSGTRRSKVEQVVYVVGAVARPGLYRLAEGSRVDDALRSAGGFTSVADPASVNLAQRTGDGDEIHVLRMGEPPAARTRTRRARKSAGHSTRAPVAAVDVNTADATTLASLPGVGTTLATRIVEYRQLNGPFASIDELADVAGMTQRRVDVLTPYLRASGAP